MQIIKKTIVSFDFDGCLSDQFFGDINSEGEDVKELFRSLASSEEFEVFVITRRFGPENSEEGQKNEHIAVYDLIEELKSGFQKKKFYLLIESTSLALLITFRLIFILMMTSGTLFYKAIFKWKLSRCSTTRLEREI